MNLKKIIKNDEKFAEIFANSPAEIIDKWEVKDYDKGEVICYQGELSDYFYYLIEGYLNIYLMAENGSKYVQSIYKSGDYFGELEIFNQQPYVCTVETLTAARIIRLERKYFMEWIKKDHDYLLYLTKTLCDSFYKLSHKAGEDMLYSLRYRICNYLGYKVEEKGSSSKRIELQIDRKQLSDQLAVTKRSINRVLKNLSEKEIIELKNSSIIIKDIKALNKEEELSRYK